MKVLLLYDYPASPGGLATQGDLLYRGLKELGVDVYPVNFESAQEKEWYYRWFRPDVVLGVGYWGHAPDLILHPQKFGIQPVPWLVANGFVPNFHKTLNDLPLILVTSEWVKEVYVRDGIRPDNIEVLPVGCDTDAFFPMDKADPKVTAVREALGIGPEDIMLLTIGGDAASKGALEMMQALAINNKRAPPWKYVCKVWPQERTQLQNSEDFKLAEELGIDQNIIYAMSKLSRNFIPYLINACDIYAAPSRLEGFGMPQVEAGACGKPVIGIKAMGMLDTLVHGETALLADIAQEIVLKETTISDDSGVMQKQKIVFPHPRTVDYRASVHDIAGFLADLMVNHERRLQLGEAARKRVVEHFDYRIVARRFVEIVSTRLGLT